MRRLMVVATVLATLLAGGCGIPDDSKVTVDGPGPARETAIGDGGAPPVQPTREATENRVDFVKNYLQAAAGDPETAANRVKAFLSPSEAAKFQGDTDVQVVRLLEDPLNTPGDPEVTLKVRVLGTLNANGQLKPAPPSSPKPVTLLVDRVEGQQGMFVIKDPQVMLLSDAALETYYRMRTIYFWNRDYTSLVPDPRYMPRSVIPVQQPTTVLSWLAAGPSPWLEDAVQRLPQGTTAPDNVPAISNDTLEINLDAPAVKPGDSQTLDRLRRQLQWSLRPLTPRTLEIKIGRQDPVRYPDAEYLNSNAAYRLADEPARFAIYNGMIRRLRGTPQDEEPVPVLKPAANKDIDTAAISASATHTFAAVVTGSGRNQVLRVAAAPLRQEADLKPAGLSGTLGRPVWAVTRDGDVTGAVGLIIRDGRLYSFAAEGQSARPVEWPGAPGPVTSVSVAPDGQRVALVSGGQLYRAVLSTGGDGIALSAPERLSPFALTKVAAVAWSSETYLTVAGMRSDRRYTVLDLSSDGVLSTERLRDLGVEPVTDLTAYPANPVTVNRATGSDWATYVMGSGVAQDVLASPVQIVPDQLVGSSAGIPASVNPTAPFFLD